MLIFLLVSSNAVSSVYYVYDIFGMIPPKPVYPQCQVSRCAYAQNCVFLPSQIYHFQGCIMLRMKLKYSQTLQYRLRHAAIYSAFIITAITTIKILVLIRSCPNRYSTGVNVLSYNKWYLKINRGIEFIVWLWKCDFQGSG